MWSASVISGGLAAASEQPDATGHPLFNVKPYRGESLWVMLASKINLTRGGVSRGWSWLDPGRVARDTAALVALRGLTGSEGEVVLFQAIFAALGFCCAGGKGAGSGCCWWWQLLGSSGFLRLPNPEAVEPPVRTDWGKRCCEENALEKSLYASGFCWFLSSFFSFFFLLNFKPF